MDLRKNEIKQLHKYIQASEKLGEGLIIYVFGAVGTGKTYTITHNIPTGYNGIYVNTAIMDTCYKIVWDIYQKVTSKPVSFRGSNLNLLMFKLKDLLQKDIIILDNIDLFYDRSYVNPKKFIELEKRFKVVLKKFNEYGINVILINNVDPEPNSLTKLTDIYFKEYSLKEIEFILSSMFNNPCYDSELNLKDNIIKNMILDL